MDYVSFNGAAHKVPYPNDFQMTRELNIVNEFVSLSGAVCADVNGWRFADATLHWDYLPEYYLQIVLSQTNTATGTFNFGFYDPHESTGRRAIKAYRVGMVTTKTRFHDAAGNIIWKDVEITLRFPEVIPNTLGG